MPTYSVANSNKKNRNPSEDFVNGFELHMFENEKPNVYKHKSLTFKHPHRETCQKWLNKITEYIPSIIFTCIKQFPIFVIKLFSTYKSDSKRKTSYNIVKSIFGTKIYT